MTPQKAAALVVLLALLPPVAAIDDFEAWGPLAAVAISSSADALVIWTPGVSDAAEPVFYNVYGVRNGTFSFLGTSDADATSAWVDGGYPQYAVTAMRANVETQPVVAATTSWPCIGIDHGPPPSVNVGCLKLITVKTSLMANLP